MESVMIQDMDVITERAKAAIAALKGERVDVHSCHESIPKELWGLPILGEKKDVDKQQ